MTQKMRLVEAWAAGFLGGFAIIGGLLFWTHHTHITAPAPVVSPSTQVHRVDEPRLTNAKKSCAGSGCLLVIGKATLLAETRGPQKSRTLVPTGVYEATYLTSSKETVFVKLQGVGPTAAIHGIFEMPNWDFMQALDVPETASGVVKLGNKSNSQQRFLNTGHSR